MQKIPFNDHFNLTELVLSGKKTQTRRFPTEKELAKYSETNKLRYSVGEIVAVSQKYMDVVAENRIDVPMTNAGWYNKMFVRAELLPNLIQITGIRTEHLQDISDQDCIAEGVQTTETPDGTLYFTDASSQAYSTPQQAYAELINKISGRGTWESNPLVAVYDFVRVR